MSTMLQCEVCGLSVNSQEQLTQHLGGKAHKKKLRAAGLNEDGTPLVVENNAGPAQETGNNVAGKKRKSSGDSEAGMCSMCNIVFNSAVQAQQHYSGNKHFKRMKIIQGEGEVAPVAQEASSLVQPPKTLMGMQFCGFCKVQVNSMEQLDKHRQGAKHKKNLEKMKSVPVTYPGTFNNTSGSTPVTAADTPKSLPSFESYLSSSFVKATESTESNMPSLDSYLKG